MADIRPFRALRPAKGSEAKIAALPYDVYNRAEAKAAALANPLSFLNIDRPETQFPEGYDMYAPEVYEKARQMLSEQIAQGFYVKEQSACYYIYELTFQGRSQTGIVAASSIDDYQSGVIARHENTRAEKEEDRIRHVDVCNAQTGPIFLAYRKHAVISRIVDRVKEDAPDYAFTGEDQVTHRGWTVREPEQISLIRESFAAVGRIYIADGHHRAASAVKVGLARRQSHPGYDGTEAFNTFLSVLFPDEELMIMDYNRVLKDLNGHTPKELLGLLGEVCTVSKAKEQVAPEGKGIFGLYLGDTWYHLRLREERRVDDPVEGLDVSALQREILSPIFGIADPKTDSRIDFVGGIRGLGELERRVHTDCAAAFSMYPTSIQELFAVADAGRLMPPKSTWFEPKLRSGLYIQQLGSCI